MIRLPILFSIIVGGGVKEKRYNASHVIAHLAGEPKLLPEYISEAVRYRTRDRQFLSWMQFPTVIRLASVGAASTEDKTPGGVPLTLEQTCSRRVRFSLLVELLA